MANAECFGEGVGSLWCCCVVAHICCSGCVCHMAWQCGVHPVDHRRTPACVVSVCVCTCAFDHGVCGHVVCRRRRGLSQKAVDYLPIAVGNC